MPLMGKNDGTDYICLFFNPKINQLTEDLYKWEESSKPIYLLQGQ